MEPRKELILAALQRFVNQRPGMDPRNYDAAGYRSESRQVTKDRHQAETLLAAVRWRDGITADALIAAAKSAYSGRLTITETPICNSVGMQHGTRCKIDYCAGQYFPTEYRRAVCAVLASALWYYTREHCKPKGEPIAKTSKRGPYPVVTGEWLRAHFRKEFGRTMQERWFS